ncbi:hypothetical protein ACFRNT_43640 [Streptomyces sp. NPDC056697]|uniref:hypothetical protein n=1 Tax=Streptomyces sp. NPDC056697 TaxID=3345915 RepID=UPI0036B02CFA
MFSYFALWRQDGIDQRIQEILRCQVREQSRRSAFPFRFAWLSWPCDRRLGLQRRHPSRLRGMALLSIMSVLLFHLVVLLERLLLP